MIKVLSVFGTRPEAIKMIPVANAIKAKTGLECIVCVTAQHREMLDQVLSVFDLKPDIDLNIMKKGQDLTDVTCRVLTEMKNVLNQVKPDVVLVHGDTTTSFATALACFYQNIKIGHVEAGLRTYQLQSPFPEEANRQLTDRISNYYFAPTISNEKNLLNEGVSSSNIFVTGNTVIDALFMAREIIHDKNQWDTLYSDDIKKLFNEKVVLITGHRRENFGDGFLNICHAISDLAKMNPLVHFVYPVHLNPNVQEPVFRILGNKNNVHLIPPMDYLSFVGLLEKSYLVLTDSGGIQEEAPSFGKPVLVMRDTTERPEAVEAGTVKLVGANKNTIVEEVDKLVNNKDLYNQMSSAINPYGDGKSSQRIADILLQELGK